MLGGLQVQLWVGERQAVGQGPLVIYWHGTGSTPSEAVSMLGDAYAEVLAEGGVIAALAESSQAGQNTSTGTWYTGDLEAIDEPWLASSSATSPCVALHDGCRRCWFPCRRDGDYLGSPQRSQTRCTVTSSV